MIKMADLRPDRVVIDPDEIAVTNEILGDFFEERDLFKITAFAFVERNEIRDAVYFSIDHRPTLAAAKFFEIG